MPAIVGTVNVNSVSGILNIGDVKIISPKTLSKTFAGAGSFNSGDKLNVHNAKSVINIYDSDTTDQTGFFQDDSENDVLPFEAHLMK